MYGLIAIRVFIFDDQNKIEHVTTKMHQQPDGQKTVKAHVK